MHVLLVGRVAGVQAGLSLAIVLVSKPNGSGASSACSPHRMDTDQPSTLHTPAAGSEADHSVHLGQPKADSLAEHNGLDILYEHAPPL